MIIKSFFNDFTNFIKYDELTTSSGLIYDATTIYCTRVFIAKKGSGDNAQILSDFRRLFRAQRVIHKDP